jgi:hypothetical protein
MIANFKKIPAAKIGMTMALIAVSGCSDFRALEQEKENFLARSTVFRGLKSASVDSSLDYVDPLTTPVVVTNPAPIVLKMAVKAVASTGFSAMYGNITSSSELEARIYDIKGATMLCRVASPIIKDTLVSQHKVYIPSTCNLADGNYQVRVSQVGAPADSSLVSDVTGSDPFTNTGASFTVKSNSAMAYAGRAASATAVALLSLPGAASANLEAPVIPVIEPPPPPPPVVQNNNGDPLIVNMHPDQLETKSIPLTAPWMGRLFNLIGSNALPYQNAKIKISWQRDPMFMYLTLPDANGEVRGIDQLFGDNTKLPDGSFSKDGMAALARFDGFSADLKRKMKAADEVIDSSDDVFSKLRLWKDKNLDGIASADELMTMDQAGIKEFSLKYNPNHHENDEYGNQTTMRSVVTMKDNSLRLFFDLWLKIPAGSKR